MIFFFCSFSVSFFYFVAMFHLTVEWSKISRRLPIHLVDCFLFGPVIFVHCVSYCFIFRTLGTTESNKIKLWVIQLTSRKSGKKKTGRTKRKEEIIERETEDGKETGWERETKKNHFFFWIVFCLQLLQCFFACHFVYRKMCVKTLNDFVIIEWANREKVDIFRK